jgi:hypothetical protein
MVGGNAVLREHCAWGCDETDAKQNGDHSNDRQESSQFHTISPEVYECWLVLIPRVFVSSSPGARQILGWPI